MFDGVSLFPNLWWRLAGVSFNGPCSTLRAGHLHQVILFVWPYASKINTFLCFHQFPNQSLHVHAQIVSAIFYQCRVSFCQHFALMIVTFFSTPIPLKNKNSSYQNRQVSKSYKSIIGKSIQALPSTRMAEMSKFILSKHTPDMHMDHVHVHDGIIRIIKH